MTTFCITTDLAKVSGADRPRPCLAKTYDTARGKWVPAHYASCVDDTCRGCVFREAEHGSRTCRTCRARIEDALARVANLIAHLRSVDSNGQAIGERVFTSMQKRLVVPDSFLAADGLLEALGAPPIPSTVDMQFHSHVDYVFRVAQDAVSEWNDLDTVVATREGAKRAVVLVQRMKTALSRWPDAEADWRPIPGIRCPNCGSFTLYRRGPLEQGDDLLIQCAGSHLMYDRIDQQASYVGTDVWELGYPYCEWTADWFHWLETHHVAIEAAFSIHNRKKTT